MACAFNTPSLCGFSQDTNNLRAQFLPGFYHFGSGMTEATLTLKYENTRLSRPLRLTSPEFTVKKESCFNFW